MEDKYPFSTWSLYPLFSESLRYIKFKNLDEIAIITNVYLHLKVSCLPKKTLLFASMIALQKWWKMLFYFILKVLFILKIYKFLSWLFGHVGKTAWLERKGYLRNSWHHNLVNKQLQYTCCPISHEVKTTRQWNLVN